MVSASGWWPGAAYPYGYPHYPGGLAAPVVLPSGYLADTPEVAHAKATHAARVASAAAAAAAAPEYPAPVVTPAGYIADTPEVAAAKAKHFAELAKAGGHVPYSYVPYAPYAYAHGYEGQYVPDHNGW